MEGVPEWGLFLIGQAFTAGAVYGAIKGDIKALVHGVGSAQNSADDAHRRIDNLLMKGGR